jgi:hypothetical protein
MRTLIVNLAIAGAVTGLFLAVLAGTIAASGT